MKHQPLGRKMQMLHFLNSPDEVTSEVFLDVFQGSRQTLQLRGAWVGGRLETLH